MKTFSKAFNTETTYARPLGLYKAYKVVHINDARNLIKLEGFEGSFQRVDIEKFTNKNKETIDLKNFRYFKDAYGSVFEKTNHENIFVGNLNGRTFKHFLNDNELIQEDLGDI